MVVSGALATSVALAGPAPRATVTLTCDKNASATVVLVALSSSGGAFAGSTGDLSCGPDTSKNVRVVIDGPLEAVTATVTDFNATSGGVVTPCSAQAVPLPARVDCPSDGGAGARIVVR